MTTGDVPTTEGQAGARRRVGQAEQKLDRGFAKKGKNAKPVLRRSNQEVLEKGRKPPQVRKESWKRLGWEEKVPRKGKGNESLKGENWGKKRPLH